MQRRWITVRQTSEYLSIHEITCRRLIDKGLIPATKVGRSVRVDLKKLAQILEGRLQLLKG